MKDKIIKPFTGWLPTKSIRNKFTPPNISHLQEFSEKGIALKLFIYLRYCNNSNNDYWVIRSNDTNYNITKYKASYDIAEVKKLALKLFRLELKLALEAHNKINKLLES